LVVTILMIGVFTPQLASRAGAGPSSQYVRPGTLLTNTALHGFSQVDQIDLLSPSLGYALATESGAKGPFRYYLVRTIDLARTWTVRSALPLAHDVYPAFSDFDSSDSNPSLDFVNRNVGYVAAPGGPIYVTVNAGTTWSKVAVLGSSSSYAVSGATVSVVSAVCPARRGTSANTECPSVLSEYHVGSTIAISSRTIPGKSAGGFTNAALLAAVPGSTQVVDLDNDNDTTPKSLLITNDDGQDWRTEANPCAKLLIEQLVVAKDGQWLLSCFLDEGMSQGTAKLFRSTNRGATWLTVVDDVDQHDKVGDLGGTPVYFFFSGNDRILYGAVMNPAGGLIYSTDGGRDWSPESLLGYSGGAPESVAVFGATSALYQVFQGATYATSNGLNWQVLPQLPAGTYKGMSICTKAAVDVSLRHVKYGGFRYTYVDFTNHANTSCYLDGIPTLQPLSARETDVGPTVTGQLVDYGGDFVVLKARGGVANMPLLVNLPSSYHPRSTCAAKKASELEINFGPPSTFRLSLGAHPITTCTKLLSAIIVSVRKGPGKP
jgi:photosystem II stability/assembly factor-like uncharacterized protein